jgi:hypothetical protein
MGVENLKIDGKSQSSSQNKSTKITDSMMENLSEGIEMDQTSKAADDLAFLDKLVIPKDIEWKSFFDILMMLVSIQNIFFNAYYAGFGVPRDYSTMYWFDQCVEMLFLADIIFMFC